MAGQFKKAFEGARDNNATLAGVAARAAVVEDKVETAEPESEDKTDVNAPEATEADPPVAETEESTREE